MDIEYIQQKIDICSKRISELEESYKQAELYYNWKREQYQEAIKDLKKWQYISESMKNLDSKKGQNNEKEQA